MAITQEQLTMYYNFAQQQGASIQIDGDVITLIPQQAVNSPGAQKPPKKPGKKLPKVLSQEQVNALMAGFEKEYKFTGDKRRITDLRDHVMFMTMLKAGLRISEVCNLSVTDVNLATGKIYVQLGKGLKDRVVPFGECLLEWLEKWDAVRPQESEYFFCTLKGGIVSDRHLKQRIKTVSERQGVYIQDGHEKKTAHAHNFRHTFATDLLNKGVNIRKVQTALGHKNVTTTEIYTEVNMSDLDREIKALG